jgi:hypothetical protein
MGLLEIEVSKHTNMAEEINEKGKEIQKCGRKGYKSV